MKSPRRRLSDTWVCAKAQHCTKVRLATGADSRVRVRVMARTRVRVTVRVRVRVIGLGLGLHPGSLLHDAA